MHAYTISFQIYHTQHRILYKLIAKNSLQVYEIQYKCSMMNQFKILCCESNEAQYLDQLPENGILAWLLGVWGPQLSVWMYQDLCRVT